MEIIQTLPKPEKWTRKGKCPVCKVGTGSRHNKKCTYQYYATK